MVCEAVHSALGVQSRGRQNLDLSVCCLGGEASLQYHLDALSYISLSFIMLAWRLLIANVDSRWMQEYRDRHITNYVTATFAFSSWGVTPLSYTAEQEGWV